MIYGREGVLCGGFDLKIIGGANDARMVQMHDAGIPLLKQIYLSLQPIVFAFTGHGVAMGARLNLAGDMRVEFSGDLRIGLNATNIGPALPTTGLERAPGKLD